MPRFSGPTDWVRKGLAFMLPYRSGALLALASALVLGLSACSNPDKQPTVGVGTVGGGAAGAVAGGLIASHPAGLAAGAVVGGGAGHLLIDRPRAKSKREQAETTRIVEQNRSEARQRAYEGSMAEHEGAIRQEARETRLKKDWSRDRTTITGGTRGASELSAGAGTGSGGGSADVMDAQRLLAAQGHYQGPVNGVYGVETEAAVKSYQAQHGLPVTGALTPGLMSQMRATL